MAVFSLPLEWHNPDHMFVIIIDTVLRTSVLSIANLQILIFNIL